MLVRLALIVIAGLSWFEPARACIPEPVTVEMTRSLRIKLDPAAPLILKGRDSAPQVSDGTGRLKVETGFESWEDQRNVLQRMIGAGDPATPVKHPNWTRLSLERSTFAKLPLTLELKVTADEKQHLLKLEYGASANKRGGCSSAEVSDY